MKADVAVMTQRRDTAQLRVSIAEAPPRGGWKDVVGQVKVPVQRQPPVERVRSHGSCGSHHRIVVRRGVVLRKREEGVRAAQEHEHRYQPPMHELDAVAGPYCTHGDADPQCERKPSPPAHVTLQRCGADVGRRMPEQRANGAGNELHRE